jgi:hypothetical protein
LRIVPLEEPERSNLWIENLELSPERVMPGDPVSIRVALGGVGGDLPPQIPVTLWIDRQQVATQLCPCPTNGEWQFATFEYPVPQRPRSEDQSGNEWRLVRATIPPDGLPADNERADVLSITSAEPLLCLSTDPSPTRPGADAAEDEVTGASYFLREYWRSATSDDADDGTVDLRELPLAQVTAEQMRSHQLVVLTGGTPPAAGQVQRLLDYVRQGGQVWLSPAEGFEPQAWNAAAWLDGAGLLPARLAQQMSGVLGAERVTEATIQRIDAGSIDLAELGSLPGVSADALRNIYAGVVLFAAVTAELPDDDPLQTTGTNSPRVLALTDRGEPLAVYRAIGRGGVLFWGTGLQPNWNNMAGSNGVLCWEHLARYLAQHGRLRTRFTPAERPRIEVPARDSHGEWTLLSALDGQPTDVVVQATRHAGRTRVEFERPLPRGGYFLQGSSPTMERAEIMPLAVSTQPASWAESESNLTSLDRAAWQKLAEGTDKNRPHGPASLSIGQVRTGAAWRYLLGILLAGLLGESLLCWRRPELARA